MAWIGSYEESQFPPWPCPRCGRHSLSIQKGSFAVLETPESSEASGHPDWEPDWKEEQFVCLLMCKESNCGCVASVAGVTEYKYSKNGRGYYGYYDRYLAPHFVEPAPEMLKIPKK